MTPSYTPLASAATSVPVCVSLLELLFNLKEAGPLFSSTMTNLMTVKC